MPWPLYDGVASRPPASNNPANTGLYVDGAQSHSFGTRLWYMPVLAMVQPGFGSFVNVSQLRKADWTPGDFDERDVSHLFSPYRVKERRASWGKPGEYQFEFNYTSELFAELNLLAPGPQWAGDGHYYIVVQDPDGSMHQMFGWFEKPTKGADVNTNENIISQKFKSAGLDFYAKSIG